MASRSTSAPSARKVQAVLVKNEPNRRPKYNVDDQGIVGSLYLEKNGEDEEREVPETITLTLPGSAFA